MIRVALKRDCGCVLFAKREQTPDSGIPGELFSRFECEHAKAQGETVTVFALTYFSDQTYWYYESEKGMVQ